MAALPFPAPHSPDPAPLPIWPQRLAQFRLAAILQPKKQIKVDLWIHDRLGEKPELISNSTQHGRGYLDYAEAEIRETLGRTTRLCTHARLPKAHETADIMISYRHVL